jgi:hypothetical protein
MEKCDKEMAEGADPEENHWLWLHISSQLIYFILFQFAVFPNIVNALHEKVYLCYFTICLKNLFLTCILNNFFSY